jgi:DNA replication protein DnaC
MTEISRLKETLATLRLKGMPQQLDAVMDRAQQAHLDTLAILHHLADIALEQRWHRAILQRWRQSARREKLPIDPFDFDHHPSRKDQKTRILSLLNLECVSAHREVICIGNPGTGKTFLATCLAYAACSANIKVLFTTAMDMINQLMAAEADHSLLKKRHHSHAPDVLVCDELGDLSLGQQGSHLFFQVISGRHQHKSTVLTTNLPFAEWGQVCDSTTVATAIADRLVHNSEVLILGGSSYRRKLT